MVLRPEHRVHDAVQANHRPWHAADEEHGKQFFTILDFKRAPPNCLLTKTLTASPYRFTSPRVMMMWCLQHLKRRKGVKRAQRMDGDTWLPESTQGTGSEDAPSSAALPKTQQVFMALARAVTQRPAPTSPANTKSAAASPWPLPVSAFSTWMPTASWSQKACATSPASTWPSNTNRSMPSCRPGAAPTANKP